MVRACEATGIIPIVRVPKNDHELIMGYLQTGAMGISVPHVNTKEQAQAVVQAVKYYPEGRRGFDYGARMSSFGITQSSRAYMEEANRETMVLIWTEEKRALDNLPEILTVKGIDAINIGPGDLALSMGLPGQSDHPAVQEEIKKAKKMILAAGINLVGEPDGVESTLKLISEGVLLISLWVGDMWASVLRDYLREVTPGGLARPFGEGPRA